MKKKILDDSILSSYIEEFFGYGSLDADYWFIGIEEGGGNSLKNIKGRIEVWKKRGANELEELHSYVAAQGNSKLFSEGARIQPTWGKLIRIQYGMKRIRPSKKEVREHQRKNLTVSDDTCLLELLPLPRRGKGSWKYNKWSGLEILESRKKYKTHILEKRRRKLHENILKHETKAVIFYGKGYLKEWEKVAGAEFTKDPKLDIWWIRNDKTVFFAINHPNARGATNEYFYKVGKFISSKIG